MTIESPDPWVNQSERRKLVLVWFHQPMTAKQLSGLTDLRLEACGQVLWELGTARLVRCLNPRARRSRVYGLTSRGRSCRGRLRRAMGLRPSEHRVPDVDWSLYGWTLFSHRAHVIKTLAEPLQPAALRRRIIAQRPYARISANNVRDVVKDLVCRGVARPVMPGKRGRVRYTLTAVGEVFQSLMWHADPLHPENVGRGPRWRTAAPRSRAALGLRDERGVRGVRGRARIGGQAGSAARERP